MNSVVEHIGGCHCGAVKFKAIASRKVKVHICNCSICIKKQIKGFIVPKANFKVLQGQDNLKLYTFNTGQALHYFCNTCGVQSFYHPRSNPDGISVMIYCIDSGTIDEVEEIEFDGQNWEKSIKEKIPSFS